MCSTLFREDTEEILLQFDLIKSFERVFQNKIKNVSICTMISCAEETAVRRSSVSSICVFPWIVVVSV